MINKFYISVYKDEILIGYLKSHCNSEYQFNITKNITKAKIYESGNECLNTTLNLNFYSKYKKIFQVTRITKQELRKIKLNKLKNY